MEQYVEILNGLRKQYESYYVAVTNIVAKEMLCQEFKPKFGGNSNTSSALGKIGNSTRPQKKYAAPQPPVRKRSAKNYLAEEHYKVPRSIPIKVQFYQIPGNAVHLQQYCIPEKSAASPRFEENYK